MKILAGSTWEDKLLKFVEIFTNRRKEFESSLAIHTGDGVGEPKTKPGSAEELAAEVNQRYDSQLLNTRCTTGG